MKRNFILILILSVFTMGVNAQNKYQISGIVTDAAGKPVDNLTVFIPFTSVGTTTNPKGEYKLENMAAGKFELVFRHISYEVHTEVISLAKGNQLELNIRMKNQVVELSEIVKKASTADWKFGYEKFREYLLGDAVGRFCEVKNPKDLFFYYEGDRLNGHATKPIEIENRYLGYTMIYFLDYFWYNQDRKSLNGKIDQVSYAFSGSAFYIDMVEDDNRRSKGWERNRELEFRGTLRHFLMSTYTGKVKDEGYSIRQGWAGLKEFQQSLNISPSVAYSRSMELEKRFFWDEKTDKSTFILYLPELEYLLEPEISKLESSNTSKSISLADPLLVFHYWDEKRKPEEVRVAYLSIKADKTGSDPQLIFTEEGEYKVVGGELIWHYLDNQTKLAISLPVDYVGRLGVELNE